MAEVARSAWRSWAAHTPRGLCIWLVTAACALLFLDAAGTLEIVYTVTPSYVLLMVACIVGVPIVFSGWRTLPAEVRLFAGMLLGVYAVSGLLADDVVLESQSRASSHRDLVYVADLALGLGVLGLVVGLSDPPRELRRFALAFVGGGAVAAAYALYQWPAQRYGLVFSDVNNAINTTGVSRGAEGSQGAGLLGWERVRGTFVEPHHLGGFLAATVPAFIGAALSMGLRRRTTVAGVVLLLLPLLLTVSTPSWAVLAVSCLGLATLVAVARGAEYSAAALSGLAVLIVILAGLALARPALLATATGRSEADLELTTEFRLNEWQRAAEAWSVRPVIGHGPGQSAVQLSSRSPRSPDRVVLGSAHGLWAASLVDAGILGLFAWGLLLGSMAFFAARHLLRRPTALALGLAGAALVAVAGSQVSGDRLELRAWVALALVAAATCGKAATHGSQRN